MPNIITAGELIQSDIGRKIVLPTGTQVLKSISHNAEFVVLYYENAPVPQWLNPKTVVGLV